MASKESRPEIDKPDTVEMKKKDLCKMRTALISTSIVLAVISVIVAFLAISGRKPDSLGYCCMGVAFYLLIYNCIHVATLGVKE